MNDNAEYPMRSPGAVVVGAILLVVAILLGLKGLSWALEDPCSGITGPCIMLVDFRPIGRMMVVFALVLGVPGAWMALWGSRSDPPGSR